MATGEQNKEKGDKKDDSKDWVATTYEDIQIICDENLVNLPCQDLCWVVDLVASFHVTTQWDFFTSYTSGDFGYVRMGNNVKCKIVGMGDVSLETGIGCQLLLKNVRHILDICLNVISMGRLDDEGYENHFGGGR